MDVEIGGRVVRGNEWDGEEVREVDEGGE